MTKGKVQDISREKLVQLTKKGKLVMRKEPYKNVLLKIKLANHRLQKRSSLFQFCQK